MQLLTLSRLHAFRKCMRYQRIRYEDGYVPTATSDPLYFGTLFHQAVAAYWLNEGHEICTGDPYLDARLSVALLAHTEGWNAIRDRYTVLAVEVPYTAPLINPDTFAASRTFRLAGVIDLLLQDAEGNVILVEHKTSGDDFSDDAAPYWRRLAMDSQLSGYVVGAESLGYQVSKILYDVTARPQLRPKEATPEEKRKYTNGRLYANQRAADETPEEYGARLLADYRERPERYFRIRETARLESDIRDGLLDTWADGRILREAQLSGRAPRNPDACHARGTCCYWEACALGVPLAESDRWKRVTGAGIFPELPAALVVGTTEMREEG